MVNYRLRGNYYVVDRLFERALLVSGVGREQDRVTIAYDGEGR
jgi:type IV secretory pathway VirB9-like protein